MASQSNPFQARRSSALSIVSSGPRKGSEITSFKAKNVSDPFTREAYTDPFTREAYTTMTCPSATKRHSSSVKEIVS